MLRVVRAAAVPLPRRLHLQLQQQHRRPVSSARLHGDAMLQPITVPLTLPALPRLRAHLRQRYAAAGVVTVFSLQIKFCFIFTNSFKQFKIRTVETYWACAESDLVCLGSWKKDDVMLAAATFNTSLSASKQDKFRCLVGTHHCDSGSDGSNCYCGTEQVDLG